ncbi:MAG: putative Ig domain-containing protein, partial [Acidobacteriota bacterium]
MPSDLFNSLSSSALRIVRVLAAVLSLSLLGATASAQIPGLQFPSDSEASDQKRGSILFFNYFTSSSATPNTINTEISITNTSSTTSVAVRLFFVDGTTGASVSTFLFLTQIQTATFLASDVLPGVSGYIVAVAVNSATQCPINFNSLAGEAVFKQATGHSASLDAVAIAAVAATPANCAGTTTTLNFDGVSYNRVPRVVSLDNIVSRTDGNDTLFIINRVGGNLTVGSSAATLAVLFGLLYDDADNVVNFTRTQSTPQFVTSLTNSFPSTVPPFQTFIPAGRIGWMKVYNNANDFGYLGASVNFNPNAGASVSAFNNGHNFTHRTLASAPTYTVPLTAPDLVVSKTHSGNFALGGLGNYSITVTNNGTAMSSMMNTITVSDQLPANLTLADYSGGGWNCTGLGTATVNCSTNATLAAGASAPLLTLTVNVGAGTPTGTNSITNTANVSNAQELNTSNNSSSNPTTVCGYTLAPTAASFVVAGGGSTVGVTTSATCAWTAVSNDAWIIITGGSSGTGNGTVSYTVAANAAAAPRTGSMTIAGQTFPVSQAATGLLVYTDFNSGIPIDWTVEHLGNGVYLPTGAPATWTTANPCNRIPGGQFSGSFALVDATCTTPGATFNERLITPSFDMTGLGTVYVEFYNRFLGVGAPNNAGDVEFSTNGGSTWPFGLQHLQNVNAGPSVLSLNLATLVGVSSSNARVRHRYTGVGIQPSGPSRPEVQEVDWAIDYAIYYYTLAPTSQNFAAIGGSGNITVATSSVVPSPQGAWTATSNAPWITPGAPGGTGNGSIGYTVAANPTGSSRTGTMTIAGNTFTITQNGCTAPTINPALPNGFVSVAYNQTLTATGGVAPYTFSVSAGTLPGGLNLTAAGVLSGTPTTNGTFSFTAKATDAIGCMGTRTYTVIISGSGTNSL